jgi:hypothetical protein
MATPSTPTSQSTLQNSPSYLAPLSPLTSSPSSLQSSSSSLQSSSSSLGSIRSESSGKIFAQTAFFHNLIKTGYQLDILRNNIEWKSVHYKFNPTSCALECHTDRDDISSKLISYISLRKFAIAHSPDPLIIILKTPNKIYKLRTRDSHLNSLFMAWFKSIQEDSHLMAEHALRLSNTTTKVITANDKIRPMYWVPKDEAEFCAACHNKFQPFGGKHTCRDCGYIYCGGEQCFNNGSIKRCNNCLTTHSTVNNDGTVKKSNAPIPLFNEATTRRSHVYFQDLNQQQLQQSQLQQSQQSQQFIDPDGNDNRQLLSQLSPPQQSRLELIQEQERHQLNIDSSGLTPSKDQTIIFGQQKNSTRNIISAFGSMNKSLEIMEKNKKLNQKRITLYFEREQLRANEMSKLTNQNSYGDLFLIGVIIVFILYLYFGQDLKFFGGMIAKRL